MNPNGANCRISTLYVGDLHPDVTEATLLETFSSAGTVLSIRVCRDVVTRRSLGYAYVNFQKHSDAEKALNTLNFDTVFGQPMRIMWCERNPSLRRSGVGNVFIKNLEKSIDNKTLHDTFCAFGDISSCKVVTDEMNVSKGYGFMQFELQKDADVAIARANGMMMKGQKVYLAKFIPREEREKTLGEKAPGFTNVYVKNFGEHLDDQKLKELFEACGNITSSKVMVDESGKSKGFGFVNFEEPEQAVKAIEDLNGKMVNGNILYVGVAQIKCERQAKLRHKFELLKAELKTRQKGLNLYVKNLAPAIDDQRLRQEFSSFGTITSAKVMTDSNHCSRGFGFVCFSSPEEATRAVRCMNNCIVESRHLYVCLAERKDERRARLPSHRVQLRDAMQMQPANSGYAVLTPPAHGNAASCSQLQIRATPQQKTAFLQQPNTYTAPPRPAIATSQNVATCTGMNTYIAPPRPAVATSRNVATSTGKNTYIAPPRPAVATSQNVATCTGMTARAVLGRQCLATATHPSMQAASVHQEQELLTASMLAETNTEGQKQMLGEHLYPIIKCWYPKLAEKITGMLLEIDNSLLLHMLKNREELRNKVEEAVSLLLSHQELRKTHVGRGN